VIEGRHRHMTRQGERAMPNSHITNLFHDDRSYLPVGLVAADSSASISSRAASAACFRGDRDTRT
jgi:hypothetical protein